MYVKSTRPSAKREVQKERSAKRDVQKFRSAKRDDQIARPRRAQTCERSELRAMRMCPRSGQIFFFIPLYQSRLMPISFYLFVNPNSRLYLSNLHSLSQSILCISTYICFYLLSIHHYFSKPLCQSKLIPISFNSIFFISA